MAFQFRRIVWTKHILRSDALGRSFRLQLYVPSRPLDNVDTLRRLHFDPDDEEKDPDERVLIVRQVWNGTRRREPPHRFGRYRTRQESIEAKQAQKRG